MEHERVCFCSSRRFSLIGFLSVIGFLVDVGEPTSHPCSMTGMIQDHHLPAH